LRDPSIAALTLGSFLVFAAVALYADRATMHLSRKTRTRPPHKSLMLLLRGWFALLAVGCLWILLEPVLLRHR
jgi:hypothetical protein